MSAKKNTPISFAGAELLLDSSGALYWPSKKILVIADMHLEKGSYYAKHGNLLPLYDIVDTLQRLEELISFYGPQTIISVGDNIHDVQAFLRMNKENSSLLHSLVASTGQWIWLVGNHDRQTLPRPDNNLLFYRDYKLDGLYFSHDFNKNERNQIVGHYHPKITYKGITGKCFIVNTDIIILPSFGTYTGGLDVCSTVFKQLMNRQCYKAYLLHRNKIWQIL